jgi:hypothetical protein
MLDDVTRDDQGQADTVLHAQIRSGHTALGVSKPQQVVLQEKDGVGGAQGLGMPGRAPAVSSESLCWAVAAGRRGGRAITICWSIVY